MKNAGKSENIRKKYGKKYIYYKKITVENIEKF